MTNLTACRSLKPCPFCWASAKIEVGSASDERSGYNFKVTIRCETCGGNIAVESKHDKNGWCNESKESATTRAIDAWNTRPTSVAYHAEGEVVAYCEPDNPFNCTAFAWPGSERDPSRHTQPLYTHPPRSGDETERAVKENLTVGDEESYREIARLIGQIFFYGNFKAQTYNERLLETLLRKTGNFHETQQQADAAMAARGGE